MDFEVFLLLVDEDRPAGFGERLGGDVGAEIENLRQAEERAFGVFDGINDVVAKRREAGLAAEVVVGIAELASFERPGVVFGQLLNVDVLQVRFGRGSKPNARGLKELDDFAGVSIDGSVGFIVDDEVEVERRELFAVAAVGHQRLNGGNDDRGTKKFARAAGRLIDHRLELRQHDGEVFHGLLRKFDTVHDEQDALGVAADEKAADERGAEQCLASAGSHFEEEFAEAFGIEEPGDLVHRSNLVAP